ncbi:MAG TPA: PAS domain S-box protein [Chthoniobacter sp.]|jgi:PAS domain S-box-containing protein
MNPPPSPTPVDPTVTPSHPEGHPIRVLIVEDSALDAELVVKELERQRFAPRWERVESEAEYLANLRPDLDVILCDYSLPNFSAARALSLLQERNQDVPLIVVSGVIAEEDAVATMKQGAADYLLKDRLARLGMAVNHAMEQSRLRRDRRKAMDDLRLFRTLVDQSTDTFEVIDPGSGQFLDVNERGCAQLGYSPADFRSLRVWEVNPVISEAEWPRLAGTIRDSSWYRHEGRHRRKNGTTFPVEINARWVNCGRDYIVAVVRDITSQKHVEVVLRESERRFREMLENVDLIAMTLDRDGTITFCNDHLLKLTGWRREEVIGGNWFSLFVPGNEELKNLYLNTVDAGTIPQHYENPIKTKSGELRDIAWNNTMLRGSAGNFIGTASLGEDVTERKRAENALRESERRFRSFMEHSPIAGWIVDDTGTFRYVSPGYYQMFRAGTADLTGKRVTEVYSLEIAEHYLANNDVVFRERRVLETVETATKPDGSTGEFVVVKFPMEPHEGAQLLGGIALDVTERKKLEQQFLRAQRMESIGTLAGGIAHDLNNSLSPIIMSLDLLKMRFPDPDSQELLETVSASARRGADMVKQVLSFGRGVDGRRMVVQVKHLIREIEKITNDTFPKNITVQSNVPHDLWPILGDPTQLHQVLLNLCVNARDAMAEGGRLTLSAENAIIDEHYAGLNPDARPGPHVLLKVADTGTGIPAETQERIFDPFFTTKEIGKGTGLGLSTSLGIVKSHDGFIRVSSKVGAGTTFQIYLPAQSDTVASEQTVLEAEMPRGKGETILVIDDEAAVREICRQTLEAFGYRVVLASDGAEALSAFASKGEEIAVVLTDVAMPVMDGPATIHVLKRMNPAVRIIATSGRATQDQLSRLASLEVKHVLAKPYTAQELLIELKTILSET